MVPALFKLSNFPFPVSEEAVGIPPPGDGKLGELVRQSTGAGTGDCFLRTRSCFSRAVAVQRG